MRHTLRVAYQFASLLNRSLPVNPCLLVCCERSVLAHTRVYSTSFTAMGLKRKAEPVDDELDNEEEHSEEGHKSSKKKGPATGKARAAVKGNASTVSDDEVSSGTGSEASYDSKDETSSDEEAVKATKKRAAPKPAPKPAAKPASTSAKPRALPASKQEPKAEVKSEDDDVKPIVKKAPQARPALAAKKEAAPAAKKPAAKAAATADGDDDSDDVKHKIKKSPAKPKAPKALKDPYVDEAGWNVVPPSLLWRDFGGTTPNARIAAYDLDGTMVNNKSNRTFATHPDDWKWYNKKVVDVIKAQRAKGFKIVIFTNQGGIKSALVGKMADIIKGKVERIVKEIGPVQVFAATMADDFRKPATGMWRFLVESCNSGVAPDLEQSFFVGDAAGRPEDFAATDKEFAEAIGIKFCTPEEAFGAMDGKRAIPPGVAKQFGDACACADNQALVDAIKALADAYFKSGVEKAGFKGAAARKAATALSGYSAKLTPSNYKDAKKLPGVGDGSLKLIKEFLDTGKLQTLEELTGGGEGAAATTAPGPSSEAQAKAAEKAEATLKFA